MPGEGAVGTVPVLTGGGHTIPAAMTASEPAATSPAVARPSLAQDSARVVAPVVVAPWSSSAALWVLVALAMLSPWPFGAVEPWAVQTMTRVALLAGCGVALEQAILGGVLRPRWPLWPVGALLALGVFQLVPLPAVV